MATYNERLQQIWHQYETETGQPASTTHDVVLWAVQNGMLQPPSIDPYMKLAEEMATALRAEYRIDERGRKYRVNHAVRTYQNGVQYTLWAQMTHAPREHMEKSFGQRRKQVVSDCVQLKTDVDVYNDAKKDQEPINLVLDFTYDVAEIQAMLEEPEPA